MFSLRAIGLLAVNLLGELVGPATCAACDAPIDAALFCPGCAASVERFDTSRTARSTRWLAAFEYGGAIATAVGRLKYQGRADLGPRLGRSTLRVAQDLRGEVDLVIPVPLHPRRLVERGYNQAALLAAPIARALDARLAPRALARLRDTPRQASLDRASRLRNVAGAFSVRQPSLVRGARVLLVDDVRTTGATLDGCLAALHEVPMGQIVSLVLACRTPT